MKFRNLIKNLIHHSLIFKTLKKKKIKIDENKKNDIIELDRELVFIDIGCRWGIEKKYLTKKKIHIYGFEPDVEECNRLNEIYKSTSIRIFPVALSGMSGRRKLYLTKDSACSSLLIPDSELTENYPALDCARHINTVNVETVTLDEWANNNNAKLVDFIKVDTQGSELEILQGATNVLKHVRYLEVEVEFNPIYVGQPIFSDVDKFLREKGFVLWKLTNHVHYSRYGSSESSIGEDVIYFDDFHKVSHEIFEGQLFWANAHYVRKDVLDMNVNSYSQNERDFALFHAIGMTDVVKHRKQLIKKVTKK